MKQPVLKTSWYADTSKDIVPYNPLDADKVVAEPTGAMPKALNTSKYSMMSLFSKIIYDYLENIHKKIMYKKCINLLFIYTVKIENL